MTIIQYQFTAEEYAAVNLRHVVFRTSMGARLALMFCVGVAIVIHDPHDIFGVLVLLSPVVLLAVTYVRARRKFQESSITTALTTVNYGDEGLAFSGEGFEFQLEWSKICSSSEFRDYFFLTPEGIKYPIIIPKRAFDQKQVWEFASLLAKRRKD